MKTIEIIVSPTGETTLQTKGFTGSTCQAASRSLERALGIAVNDQRTPEALQVSSERSQARGLQNG